MAATLATRPAAALLRRTTPILPVRPVRVARPVAKPLQERLVTVRSSDADTKGVLGEFVGSTLFQLIGSAATLGGAEAAIAANSMGLIALIYAFGGVSGAHLNPAVSFMLFLKKQISSSKFLAYAAAQVAGCVLGALLCTVLIPGVAAGMGAAGPGAWAPAASLSQAAVFGWEALMTGLLCTVVWGAAVAKPGAGNAAPIAIGLTVMVSALACGGLSGSVINPARALGPAIVFKNLAAGTVALVVAAQMAGAALAATAAAVFYSA